MTMPWQPMVTPAAPLAHVPFHHTSTPNHLILNMINTCREPPGQRDVGNRQGKEMLRRPHQEKIHLLENGLKVLKMAF
jgi:hypothetical protein